MFATKKIQNLNFGTDGVPYSKCFVCITTHDPEHGYKASEKDRQVLDASSAFPLKEDTCGDRKWPVSDFSDFFPNFYGLFYKKRDVLQRHY